MDSRQCGSSRPSNRLNVVEPHETLDQLTARAEVPLVVAPIVSEAAEDADQPGHRRFLLICLLFLLLNLPISLRACLRLSAPRYSQRILPVQKVSTVSCFSALLPPVSCPLLP